MSNVCIRDENGVFRLLPAPKERQLSATTKVLQKIDCYFFNNTHAKIEDYVFMMKGGACACTVEDTLVLLQNSGMVPRRVIESIMQVNAGGLMLCHKRDVTTTHLYHLATQRLRQVCVYIRDDCIDFISNQDRRRRHKIRFEPGVMSMLRGACNRWRIKDHSLFLCWARFVLHDDMFRKLIALLVGQEDPSARDLLANHWRRYLLQSPLDKKAKFHLTREVTLDYLWTTLSIRKYPLWVWVKEIGISRNKVVACNYNQQLMREPVCIRSVLNCISSMGEGNTKRRLIRVLDGMFRVLLLRLGGVLSLVSTSK